MMNYCIYFRDDKGKHHQFAADKNGKQAIYDFCKEMSEMENSDKFEIEMVNADGICLFNSLNQDPISWEDLLNLFA